VKHCPWCSYGDAGFAIALGLIVAPQLAISFWPGRPLWKYRLPLSIAGFLVFGMLAGGLYGVISGYWRA
jgi:asparagine N-glycosylation enzyme membrane subunit Stt3